jgi:hypothetical protein
MSTLKVNTLTDTAATKSVPIEDVVNGVARAWVNFNGTSTVAIRASYNVTDITDNGTGVYTVNLTTAMPDTNYSWVGTCESASNTGGLIICKRYATALTTSAIRLQTLDVGNAATDPREVYIVIFR